MLTFLFSLFYHINRFFVNLVNLNKEIFALLKRDNQ